MKAQSAAAMGALAAVGLVAAYTTWQRPAEERDTEATVLDLSRAALERIRYEDGKRVVEVVTARDGTWVRQTEKPPAPPPPPPIATEAASDGGVQPASALAEHPPEPAPAPAAKTREYKANETADRLVDKFAPLRALRALGVLSEEKLAELGLASSERTLEVTARGTTATFRLATAGQGSGSPYARSEDDGQVYLLRGTLLADLEFAASRLVDRRLHTFREDAYDALRIVVGDKERTLVKAGKALAEPGSGAVDEFATNWHGRVWSQGAGLEVLGRGEDPAAGVPEVQVRVEYLRGTRSVGHLELAKAGEDLFARTEHTAGWVRLHGGARQLVEEREQVVGGK